MGEKETLISTAYSGTWLFVCLLIIISIATLIINFLY